MTQVPRVVFTLDQVARALGVRRASVAAWAKDGRLVAVSIEGRVRVGKEELDRIAREGIPRLQTAAPKRPAAKRPNRKSLPGDDIRNLDV